MAPEYTQLQKMDESINLRSIQKACVYLCIYISPPFFVLTVVIQRSEAVELNSDKNVVRLRQARCVESEKETSTNRW